MQLFHVTIVTVGRLPMFLDEASRRAALHALGGLPAETLVFFAVVDDHVHLVLRVEAAAVGRIARDLAFALVPLAATELQSAHVEPITDDGHLLRTYRYALEQPVHHGLAEHPALYSGSCFPELIGARAVPGLQLHLKGAFPRPEARPDPGPIVGLPAGAFEPAPDSVVRRLGAFRLVQAAAFAAGAGNIESGRDPVNARARRAAVQLAAAVELDRAETTYNLRIDRDSVRRLEQGEADAALIRATRVRLAMEQAVAHAARAMAIRLMAEAINRRKDGLRRSA